jgi:hypothetical protein
VLSHFNDRFGTASVIAVVALIFAMSGGAFAARDYVAESSSQKRQKPRRGPRGPRGIQGIQGPQGLQGLPGLGVQGPEGQVGQKGPEGSPWVAGGALPSGKTESGTWIAAVFEVEPGKSEGGAAISFGIRLLLPPEVHLIAEGEEGNEHATECPGTVALPRAAKGNLCLYTAEDQGLELEENYPFVSGALLKFKGPPNKAAAGTWAVTGS